MTEYAENRVDPIGPRISRDEMHDAFVAERQ